jgi:hypothetical protein
MPPKRKLPSAECPQPREKRFAPDALSLAPSSLSAAHLSVMATSVMSDGAARAQANKKKDSAEEKPLPLPRISNVQYYFIFDARRSFSREQVHELIYTLLYQRHAFGIHYCKQGLHYAFAPSFADYILEADGPVRSAAEHLERSLGRTVVLDVSRTAGDTVCPLSTSEYERPVLLTANGRSYSLNVFCDTIKKSLRVGKKLCLEDGTVLCPETARVHCYEHFNLTKWDSPRSSPADIESYPRFDATKGFDAHNIPQFSEWLNEIKPDSDGLWDTALQLVYNKYRGRRPDAPPHISHESPPIFEDLEVVCIPIPRAVPKQPACFKNTQFVGCVFFYAEDFPLAFFACKFEQCAFYVDEGAFGWWQSCEFCACTFYWSLHYASIGFPHGLVYRDGARNASKYTYVGLDALTRAHMATLDAADLRDRLERSAAEQAEVVPTP